MSDLDSLSSLLGRIYDTTLDRTLWQTVVGDIAAYVPGSFVNLFSQDAVQKTAEAFYTFGIEPNFLQLYFDKYIHINPLFPAMLFFDVEQRSEEHTSELQSRVDISYAVFCLTQKKDSSAIVNRPARYQHERALQTYTIHST